MYPERDPGEGCLAEQAPAECVHHVPFVDRCTLEEIDEQARLLSRVMCEP
jgi:hypothetical protein